MSETRSAQAAVAASATPVLMERVSWASVLAGALVALAIMVVLNLLGLAAGLYVLDAQDEALGAGGAATTMGVWWILSLLFALFVGGWAAGRLTGNPSELVAGLHGVAVWAVATLAAVWMVSSAASAAFTGAAGLVGRAATVTGEATEGAVDLFSPASNYAADALATELREAGVTVDPAQIRQEASTVIQQAISPAERQQLESLARSAVLSAAQNPEQARAELTQFLNQAFGANGVIGPEDRRQAVSAMSDRLGIPEAQLNTAVNNWQAQFSTGPEFEAQLAQLERDIAVATEDTASAIADTALWTGIGLLLALAAAAGGGIAGRPSSAAAPYGRVATTAG